MTAGNLMLDAAASAAKRYELEEAEREVRVAAHLKSMSMAQKRVLVSIWHLGLPRWHQALDFAKTNYGAGSRMSYRTIEPLLRRNLVENATATNAAGHNLGKLLHLTSDGQLAAWKLREEFGERK